MKPHSKEQLKKLAIDFASGDIYTSLSVPPELLEMVFMPLALISKETVEELESLPREEQPGIFFEYYDKAGPRSINGHPIFWSVQWIQIGQMDKFQELFEKAREGFEKVKDSL